ncbi:hypothetical protein ACFWOL_17430 [Streptomyces sp. NPDC058442]|uniref:hypothetical protein n=1 Tax=Streptomyces sp. NPDC058442 TaxID=3346503 RepID=UPI0036591A13
MSDDADDVVGVLTEQIEQRFGMNIGTLKAAVTAAPDANRQATDIVRWHGLLTESQTVLERAEDDLLRALETQPSEVDDPTMDLAHRVNAAVSTRDGRAMVVRWLLDPDAPGKRGPAADRLARLNRSQRPGPAVPTSAPARPATAPATGQGALR